MLYPCNMQSGSVLSSRRIPSTVRIKGQEFCVIGESYVHGLMEGQAVMSGVQMQEFLVR